MTNFISLPRELRDHIYHQVLISPLPIQLDKVLGPMICHPDLLNPMAMLFAWASNRQIAHEACEIFYQCNTFSVYCEDLPTILGANIHRMLSIHVNEFVHKLKPTCARSFEIKEWVTDISVVIEHDNTKYFRDLTSELRWLLECPRLRKLTIRTGRNTVISWEKDWTGVLKDLELKIGEGLKVIYGNP